MLRARLPAPPRCGEKVKKHPAGTCKNMQVIGGGTAA
jgi:hypothetical protein